MSHGKWPRGLGDYIKSKTGSVTFLGPSLPETGYAGLFQHLFTLCLCVISNRDMISASGNGTSCLGWG